MKLHQLKPGARFNVVGLDTEYQLLNLGSCSALVRPTAGRRVQGFDTFGGQHVDTFTRPSEPTRISLNTNVEEI